ncbi:MAG: hypothetical protein K1W16_05215 [Lachnospiraceae bacterium]
MAYYNMNFTKQNIRIADEIIEILVKEKCTVSQAEGILHEVASGVRRCGAVQRVNYQELFKDDVLE